MAGLQEKEYEQQLNDARNERLALGGGLENKAASENRLKQQRNFGQGHNRVPSFGYSDNYSRPGNEFSRQQQYRDKLIKARQSDDQKNAQESVLEESDGNIHDYYKERVERAVKNYKDAKKLGGEAKTLMKSATPWGFFSLMSKINIFTDWTYGAALFVAIVKDLLDFVGVGSLPAIGTAITFCASLFIMFMMILGNIMHKEHDRTIFQSYVLKRWGVLIVVTILELIFGLDFIPWETIGVLLIYSFALAARKGRDSVVEKEEEEF